MANPTAIQDRLVLSIDQVKDALDITGDSDDFLLNTSLAAAKIDADAYCNNPFEDDDGIELSIPETITIGVIFWIKTVLGIKDQSSIGVTAEKAGDVSRSFGVGLSGLIASNPQVRSYFEFHRLSPGL